MAEAKKIIGRSVFDSRQTEKNKWLNRRGQAIDFYRGDVVDLIKKSFPSSWHLVPLYTNNMTKRVIDRISLVYTEPVIRHVDNVHYAGVTSMKDQDLLFAERMTNLLNIILIKASWRNGEIRYDFIDDFEIVTDENDKNKIVSVSFPLGAPSNILGSIDDIWEMWTEDEIITFKNTFGADKVIIKTEENPFLTLPFVVVKTQEGRFSLTDIEPAADLAGCNAAVNVNITDVNLNIHLRSAGQPYIIGGPVVSDNDPPVEMSGDTMMSIPTNPEGTTSVGILSPDDTVEGIRNNIITQYRMVAQNYHLSTAFVEGNEQATSGVALRIRNEELRDHRKQSITLWRNVENKLYNIERQIIFTNLDVTLPHEFSVDFGEKVVILTQAEVEAQNKFDLELGLITGAQILQRRDPDRFETLDEYQEFIDENKRVNAGSADAVSLNDILQSE